MILRSAHLFSEIVLLCKKIRYTIMEQEKKVLTTSDNYRLPYNFGLGGVPIGNEFKPVTDIEAQQTLEAAWNAGVRYYDVSPWYGLGLAERRFGQFLHNQNRSAYVISSKVGKLLKASKD